MYYEADQVMRTLRADARFNCGSLLDQISVTSPTPSKNSSTEKV